MLHIAQALFWMALIAYLELRRPEVRKSLASICGRCRDAARRRVVSATRSLAALERGVTLSPRAGRHATSQAKERHA